MFGFFYRLVFVCFALMFIQGSVFAAGEFITTWTTSTANQSITIPTDSSETYNYTVDWGDGTIDVGLTGDATHIYTGAGNHIVEITGLFPAIKTEGATNALNLIEVNQWGTGVWTTMRHAFDGSNVNIVATDVPDLSMVTDMGFMFREAFLMNGDISAWDVSNVTFMDSMFQDADLFNQSLSGWNVSSVVDMNGMFQDTDVFNQDISGWDVSSVTDMGHMFRGTDIFNQSLSGWDVSSVTEMGFMFESANAFNQDIGGWDVSNVRYMDVMFGSNDVFNQDIGGWDVSNVVSMDAMFEFADLFNQDISGWDVSSVTNMDWMFQYTSAFDQDLGGRDVGSLTTANNMFDGAVLSDTNYDLLLQSRGTQIVQNGVNLGTVPAEYCTGGQARDTLLNTYSWTINDDGQSAGCNLDPTDIILSVLSIPENTTTIGDFSTVDNSVNDTHTYSLVAGTGSEDNSSLSLTTSGALSFLVAPDFEVPTDLGDGVGNNTYSVRVETTDGSGTMYQEIFVVTVTNVNESKLGGSSSSITTSNIQQETTALVDENATAAEGESEKEQEMEPETKSESIDTDTTNDEEVCEHTDAIGQAYCFAKKHEITTMENLEKALPEGSLYRMDFAKMMVNFSHDVLGRDLPTEISSSCQTYTDIDEVEKPLQNYIAQACELGIMGVKADGSTPLDTFMPYSTLTQAEFATIVSRLLWGDMYNKEDRTSEFWYEDHMNIMKEKGYVEFGITDRNVIQIRKNVWMTLEKIAKSL